MHASHVVLFASLNGKNSYIFAGIVLETYENRSLRFQGHAILQNGMEPMRNIPQDAEMQNTYFKAYNGQIYA